MGRSKNLDSQNLSPKINLNTYKVSFFQSTEHLTLFFILNASRVHCQSATSGISDLILVEQRVGHMLGFTCICLSPSACTPSVSDPATLAWETPGRAHTGHHRAGPCKILTEKQNSKAPCSLNLTSPRGLDSLETLDKGKCASEFLHSLLRNHPFRDQPSQAHTPV